jgi:hypothetical protein
VRGVQALAVKHDTVTFDDVHGDGVEYDPRQVIFLYAAAKIVIGLGAYVDILITP